MNSDVSTFTLKLAILIHSFMANHGIMNLSNISRFWVFSCLIFPRRSIKSTYFSFYLRENSSDCLQYQKTRSTFLPASLWFDRNIFNFLSPTFWKITILTFRVYFSNYSTGKIFLTKLTNSDPEPGPYLYSSYSLSSIIGEPYHGLSVIVSPTFLIISSALPTRSGISLF